MKTLILFCLMAMFVGCTTMPLVDPTATWDVVTTDCSSAAVTGVTYNVYYSTSAIPTVAVAAVVPCAAMTMIDSTKIAKHNTSPITTNTYHFDVPNGTYNVAVESVLPDGTRGGFSQAVVTVLNRPGTPVNLKLSN